MKLFWMLLAVVPASAQIEATAPATGMLVIDRILLDGHRIDPGMQRADAVSLLGQFKVIQKLRQTSSTALIADFDKAERITYDLSESQRMRALRLGSALPDPDERLLRFGPAMAKLIVPKCGSCWMETVERPLGKKEALRVIFIGPARDTLSVACIIVDKTRNGLSSGRRYLYLTDEVVRVTEAPGDLLVEEVDPATGVVTASRKAPASLPPVQHH